jgi:group I intron endonuclease
MEFININEDKNKSGIYCIENKLNHKKYIGQTKQKFIKRYWYHLWSLRNGNHFNKKLLNSFNKNNEDDFIFYMVEEEYDVDKINELEKKYIKEFNTIESGYNISEGGQEQHLVQYVSAESRKKVGQLNKERMTGKKLSEETKQRMREASHHQRQSEDGRRRISEAMKNRIVSDETKEKLRNANIGSKSPVAVLDEEKVKEIKISLMDGVKQSELAKQFNVSYGVISAIKHNRTWTHVKIDT